MVPRKKGQGGKGGSQKRKRKTTKGAAKGRKRGAAKIVEPPALVDPELAIVVKRSIRVHIVALGHQREISPSEIAEAYDMDLGYISDQFTILKNADFLELVDEVKVRGTVKHMYRSVKRAFISDFSLLEEPLQEEWNDAFVRELNDRLSDAMEAGTLNSRNDRVLYWKALMLDDLSWLETGKVAAWAIEEGNEEEVRTAERHAKGQASGSIPVTFVVMMFESPKESERKLGRSKKRKPTQRPKRKRKPPKKGKGKES